MAVALLVAFLAAGCVSGTGMVSTTVVTANPVAPVAPARGGSVSRALPVLPEVMDAATFATWLATPGIVVIDVRTAAEFAAGHLVGAKNIDIQSSSFAAKIDALSRSGAYLLYCRTGSRSAQALAAMKDAGFASVGQLSGGIGAWQASGGRVVGS